MAPRAGASKSGARPEKERIGRGFARAGGLIGEQLRVVAGRKGFAEARLRALWPEIAGPDCAAVTEPVKLALARGPAGGVLTLAVAGAHAPEIQMMVPALRERINAVLGAGAVGRIQLTHGRARAQPGFAESPAAFTRTAAPPPDLGPVRAELSSIGDEDLRQALETLARNVLSRTRRPQ